MGLMEMSDPQEIFVRAHTIVSQKRPRQGTALPHWPKHVLVIDTETTIDAMQKLTFGAYRRLKLTEIGYQCVEEGLFYDDELDAKQIAMLQQYIEDPANLPGIEVKMFPPKSRLPLMPRPVFVERVFWKSIRKGDMIVGFNLPFDLSRLAVKASPSDDGGWSFTLSLRRNRTTGELEPYPERPRIVIKSLDSKMAFIGLGSIFHQDEWPRENRFLDLRTLGRALRDHSYNLEGACEAFGVRGKMKHKPTGRVTIKEINYCREDVRATASLLNAMKKEFDQHPINLRPDKAYSPASIAKSYLDVMGICQPKANFKVSDKELGIAMQGYYGGRAEVRIRKTHVPVVHTDFTSQYPTVNALLGNWDLLTAGKVHFEVCTDDVREMMAGLKLENTFDPTFWKRLLFFALVLPDADILPVRTVYNGRTQNIGINYLTSPQAMWYAGPDVVSSVLQANKPPHILTAIRIVPSTRQSGLKPTNLAGMVAINPQSDDFFCHVIEQKTLHKPTNKGLSHFLKILANSGSYGLFVEVNQESARKTADVQIFSGEIVRKESLMEIEKAGPWYFPPLASLITAGGRLLLSMLEKSVTEAGGSYLFCDTDSLCIVSNENGGLVPCLGGNHNLDGSGEAVKALSWQAVDEIAVKFNRLNPYNKSLVREILKIEDINFVDSDSRKARRQLFGYAISAKRYALYTKTEDGISVAKASGHGLGYLLAPKEGMDESANAPLWITETWEWLLRKDLGLPCEEPTWLDLPAMMRMTLTSPNVMRTNRPEWLSPFNFFLFPILSTLGGYPAGCDCSNFRFITRFESDRGKWTKLEGINLLDGQHYLMESFPNGKQNKVVPETFRIILRLYLRRPESKSLAPDGNPCTADTHGLLKRASVVAGEIVPIGKEMDRRWEQGEDIDLLDSQVLEYRAEGKLVSADDLFREKMLKFGVRQLMREAGLSQKTIYAVLRGQPVRQRTLATLKRAVGALLV
jgi:hypothetical protein